jgi:hypothetical protein
MPDHGRLRGLARQIGGIDPAGERVRVGRESDLILHGSHPIANGRPVALAGRIVDGTMTDGRVDRDRSMTGARPETPEDSPSGLALKVLMMGDMGRVASSGARPTT